MADNYSDLNKEIDDAIEYLSHEVTKLNDILYKTELQCALMKAKLKREKVKALVVVVRSQEILSGIKILVAQSDLYSDLERLKERNLFKMERERGSSRPSTKSFLDQNTQKTFEEKKKKKSKHCRPTRKFPVDVPINLDNPSSDETVIVETCERNRTEIAKECSQLPCNVPDKPQIEYISDSDKSFSMSSKAEFNKSYPKTDTEASYNKTHKNTKKTVKKLDSKSLTSNESDIAQRNQSPGITTKSLNEINNDTISPSTSRISVSTYKQRQKNRLEPYSYDKKAIPSTDIPRKRKLSPVMVSVRDFLVPTTTSLISTSMYGDTAVTQSNLYSSPNSECGTYNFHGSR